MSWRGERPGTARSTDLAAPRQPLRARGRLLRARSVTILGGGDLAPRRNRRRTRGPVLATLAVLVLLAVAGGGYYLLSTSRAAPPVRPCPTPTVAVRLPPRLPDPGSVHVRVLNGTVRRGLARETASLLRARGFVVNGVGNTPGLVPGAPVVRYGAGGQSAAELVALQLPGALVVFDPSVVERVDLVLGSAFSRLRTPAEVSTALRSRTLRSAAASPQPSPTCR